MMTYDQHKLYKNIQKIMDCECPLGMIHFSLILHQNMCMTYAEEPVNMGISFLTLGVLQKRYIFRPPKHTHLGIFILELPFLLRRLQSVVRHFDISSIGEEKYQAPFSDHLTTSCHSLKANILTKYWFKYSRYISINLKIRLTDSPGI